MDTGPYRCILCRFWAEVDDAIVATRYGGCICLRCYLRETETEKPLPAWLRREVTSAMAGA